MRDPMYAGTSGGRQSWSNKVRSGVCYKTACTLGSKVGVIKTFALVVY